METIRLIIFRDSGKGNREGVVFTEDFEVDANDHVPYGCTLYADVKIDVSGWPSGFPMEHTLEKQS